MRNTLAAERCHNREDALLDIYRVLRPGEPPNLDTAENLFHGLFFDSRALRSVAGRPGQDERAAQPRHRRHGARAAQRGHSRGDQASDRDQGRPRRDRRHRPSRQPPGALGRRADGEPVPGRPAAHGARGARAHELGRDRRRDAARSDQRQAGGGGGARVLRLLAALAVHGSDQPALGDHPQAPAVGARAGRPDPRARGLRGARRAPDPLWPDLPDRDPGRAQHRPDQQPRDLCPDQQVRLHREPLPAHRRRPGHRRGGLPLGDGGGALHDRPGQRRAVRGPALRARPGELPRERRFRAGAARDDRLHRRLAQAAGVGRGGADPVPRERRRQPRADGLQHAAPGGAADPERGAAGRHRHGGGGGARLGRGDRGAARRRGRPGRRLAHRDPRHRRDRARRFGGRHLQSPEVPALQPEHLHQPAPGGEGRRPGGRGRHRRRRAVDQPGRARARPQRAGRVHALERLQLRGLDPDLRADRARRRVHLDPHRGVRGHGARHQARAGVDHPRHPERRRGIAAQSRRGRDRLHRRRGPGRRHPGRQGHAQGRDPDDPGREAAARDLRREGGRRARHLAQGAARRHRHGGRGARVLAPRHRQGRARDGDRARRDRAPRQGPRRRAGDPRPQHLRPPARAARGPGAEQRAQGARPQQAAHRRGAGRAGAPPVVGDRGRRRAAHGRDRAAQAPARRRPQAAAGAVRQQGREAAARRRTAAGRAQDGQGVRRGEAQAAAGRQDGRPARQQGRDLEDRADRGHAASRGRQAGRHRAQSAWACPRG